MITEVEHAYLAGFFDGEGCVSIVEDGSGKNTQSPKLGLIVNITSCDKHILDLWASKTGIGSVYIGTKARGNARTGNQWKASSRGATELLQLIYPYLNIKKKEADIAFKFQETMGGHSGSSKNSHGGQRVPDEVIQQRYLYKDELTRLKGTTKRGRPRTHPTRRRDFAEAMEGE
ncbi:MAG: LAGLIDADG family homing endonuclease [Saccharofermentanales bacterium]